MRHDPARRAAAAGPAFWRQLEAALIALAGGTGAVLRHTAREWASATFAGTRHQIELAFQGPAAIAAAEHLIAHLPEHEFALPGRIVADAAIVAVDHRTLPEAVLAVTCELLLLVDA